MKSEEVPYPKFDPKTEFLIRPSQGWIGFEWREIFRYSDLLFLLVRRDFVAKYKQTILGPVWFVVQPLMMTLMFSVIFGGVAKIPTDGAPHTLFYLCGLLPWVYFSETMNTTSKTLVTNANLFSKVYFPRLILPLSAVLSNLITFAIQLATFIGFWLYFKLFTVAGPSIKPNLFLVALPFLLLQTAAIGLGVGLWIAALTAKYRDFTHLTAFLTQLWMYATPIIYPLSEIPAQYRVLVSLNPMAGIVEAYKYAFLGVATINTSLLLVSALSTLILLITGLLLFGKIEQTFVDII